MRLNLGFALAALSCSLLLADDTVKTEKSHPRVRFGGLVVNAGYSHTSGYPYGYRYGYGYYPGFWGYGPFAYDPFLFSPYLHPGFYTGFGYQPSLGEVKMQNPDRNAWVYIDGALAGRADKLKNMWLEPGAYQLEVRAGDRKLSQKIYVLSGRTLKVTPEMMEVRP